MLTALKYSIPKHFSDHYLVDYGVGYLISKEGKITHNLDEALVININVVVNCVEYKAEDGLLKTYELEEDKTCPRIEFYRDGLYIDLYPFEKAQEWLNNHPLPRKSIGKMTRLNVYNKYGGHCAYCGCDIEPKDMQVDHLVAHMGGGGEDTLDNYMPACEVCNRVKSNLDLDRFRLSVQRCGEIHRNRKKPIMADSDKIAIKYDLTKENHNIEFYFEKYEKTPKINVDNVNAIFNNKTK